MLGGERWQFEQKLVRAFRRLLARGAGIHTEHHYFLPHPTNIMSRYGPVAVWGAVRERDLAGGTHKVMSCVDPCATREQTSESPYQFLFKLPTFAAEQPGPLRKSRRFEQECRVVMLEPPRLTRRTGSEALLLGHVGDAPRPVRLKYLRNGDLITIKISTTFPNFDLI